MRKFIAVLRPRKATLSIEDRKERVPLQLSTLDEDGAREIHLDSVGIADADETQRELIRALLERHSLRTTHLWDALTGPIIISRPSALDPLNKNITQSPES